MSRESYHNLVVHPLSLDPYIKCVICGELWPTTASRHVEPLRRERSQIRPPLGTLRRRDLFLPSRKDMF
jgi:hypothetical protein